MHSCNQSVPRGILRIHRDCIARGSAVPGYKYFHSRYRHGHKTCPFSSRTTSGSIRSFVRLSS